VNFRTTLAIERIAPLHAAQSSQRMSLPRRDPIILVLDGRMSDSEDEDEDEEQRLREAELNALPKNLIHRVRISSRAAVKGGFSTMTNALILLCAFALAQFVHAASSVNKVCIRIRCRAREVCYAPLPVP